MKYKITDLMDLYEDKNCPLAPLDKNMQKIENNKEIIEVKASKHAFDWKQGLALAASVALLVVSGFGVKALMNRTNPNPGANPGTTEASVVETTLSTEIKENESLLETNEVTEPAVETTAPKKVPTLAEIWPQLNPLLSAFAQQGVQNSKDLISEEDLVTFAFEYFAWNEQKFSATLEEYNEFLTRTLGETVSPTDGTSYLDGYLTFRDGKFTAEAAVGDPHNTFAIGTVLDNEPYDREGRIVLSVAFTVFTPTEYDADWGAMMQLTEEEALAMAATGELRYIADGQAWVELVDGDLRMVGYELIEHEEVAGPLDADVVEAQLNPLLTAFAEQYQHSFDILTADEEWLVSFAFKHCLLCGNGKTWSYSLDQINDVLTQLVGLTVSPKDGSSFWDGFLQYNDGIFHMEPAYGDGNTQFAIGASMDATPRERDGRIVYDVAFKVYNDPNDLYDYDHDLLQKTVEEADELVESGRLEYVGAGRAEVEYVDGKLRIVHYEKHNAAE